MGDPNYEIVSGEANYPFEAQPAAPVGQIRARVHKTKRDRSLGRGINRRHPRMIKRGLEVRAH